ncbi:MAG: DEAD/DEAH box helicase [Clostridia bacterium]|nr:DEAD/DEAH box helicase [Clostridia bacterium]
MFKTPLTKILNNTMPLNYTKGRDYFQEGRVKSVKFCQDNYEFSAIVSGTTDYDVHINYDNEGELQEVDCTCPAHGKHWGYCKHTIAALLFINNRDEQGVFKDLEAKKVARHVFRFFQGREAIIKTPVKLEVTYGLIPGKFYGSKPHSSLSLKVGDDKLYVVKSIRKFFESIEKGEEVQFGKKFSFDPARHTFREEDTPLIDFLKGIYESEKLMNEITYNYTTATLLKDKHVYMTNNGLKKFFELYKDRTFKANILETEYDEMRVESTGLNIKFQLSKEEDNLILGMNFDKDLIFLTDDGEYVFSNERIYSLSRGQRESFMPFYRISEQQKSNKLRFASEYMERFVSEVLPFAEKAGQLQISKNVEELIEKIPLSTEIYLDRSGNNITAEVKFVYGDRGINPFAPVDKSAQDTEKILVRDLEGERIVLDLLAQSDFKVKDNRIYLGNENDNIFQFVMEVVPKLQEYANVFYSESFKNVTIRESYAFSGRIRLNTETDMLEFAFNMEGIDPSELAGIFNSLRQKKKYYQLKNGGFLNLDSKEVQEVSGFMEYLSLDSLDPEKGMVEIPRFRGLYIDEQIRQLGLKTVERSHAFKAFVQDIREPEDMEFKIPEGLNANLREYQKFGFKWLKTLSAYKLGGILADDMGLGKTIQIITLILSDKKEYGQAPSLIVVPTSLVSNWCAEVERFAPELRVVTISGNKDERAKQMEDINEADMVITSYPLIRRDIDDYHNYSFRYCVLDEAQHIKNPNSQGSKAVKQIKAQKRLALTGTPVENALTELWSIFDFVMPGYLFSHKKFTDKYERPIVKEESKHELEELGKQIKPFVLRRLKRDVLRELPEKIENKMLAELTDEQKKVYLAYLQQARGEIKKEIEKNGFEKSHIKILAALTRLRQVCCHPSLFLEDYNGESGKLLLLQELIHDSIEGGHRVLLFSQFTSMLQIIREWLAKEKIESVYLDGSTPAEERGLLVRSFNEGMGKVFLLSLKAGGTGLNLTGADTVIHYDPWWNPAVEDQATDRAYRIGQKNSVHVMKLITKGTIEEKIYKLQEKKKELIDSVIQPGETLITKMTQEDIQSLFE